MQRVYICTLRYYYFFPTRATTHTKPALGQSSDEHFAGRLTKGLCWPKCSLDRSSKPGRVTGRGEGRREGVEGWRVVSWHVLMMIQWQVYTA